MAKEIINTARQVLDVVMTGSSKPHGDEQRLVCRIGVGESLVAWESRRATRWEAPSTWQEGKPAWVGGARLQGSRLAACQRREGREPERQARALALAPSRGLPWKEMAKTLARCRVREVRPAPRWGWGPPLPWEAWRWRERGRQQQAQGLGCCRCLTCPKRGIRWESWTWARWWVPRKSGWAGSRRWARCCKHHRHRQQWLLGLARNEAWQGTLCGLLRRCDSAWSCWATFYVLVLVGKDVASCWFFFKQAKDCSSKTCNEGFFFLSNLFQTNS